MHKICRRYKITVSDKLGLMKQSVLGTISVNQKRLPYWKDTETIWYSQDTVMSRSISFQTVEYGIPWRWTLARDDTRLWKFSPPPEQPRLHPFHMLANLALFQGPSHLAGFINLRIMQDKIDLWSKKDSEIAGNDVRGTGATCGRTVPRSPPLALYLKNIW